MDRISMCKKKLDIFVVVEHSSLPLKTGQDGRISYNELCGIGQLDLESLSMFAWKWWLCTAMLRSDSSPLPFMIIKLQSLSQGWALPHSYSCAIFCWHRWELPAIWWKQTFALFWLATPHSNDSIFLSEFNCRTVRNCPSWWYIKVLVAHWGVFPPLRAIVYVIIRFWLLCSVEWSKPYQKSHLSVPDLDPSLGVHGGPGDEGQEPWIPPSR